MDRSTEILSSLQRFFAGGRFEDGIAHAFQIFPGHVAEISRIFGEQDCLAAAQGGWVWRFQFTRVSGLLDPLQINLKDSALMKFTVNPDVSAALVHDAGYRGETQAGA